VPFGFFHPRAFHAQVCGEADFISKGALFAADGPSAWPKAKAPKAFLSKEGSGLRPEGLRQLCKRKPGKFGALKGRKPCIQRLLSKR